MKPRKHAELIKAWADGAEIQFRVKGGEWIETVDTPAWKENLEYRIKPEEKTPVVRYLWAYDNQLINRFATEEEAAMNVGGRIYKRLDWSRTEFEE
jgi:hypothetical protein